LRKVAHSQLSLTTLGYGHAEILGRWDPEKREVLSLVTKVTAFEPRVKSPAIETDSARWRKEGRSGQVMDIFETTLDYENWMGQHVRMIDHQLREKHAKMNADLFAFSEAPLPLASSVDVGRSADALNAPQILAIGDLRVDSFGTWRDLEGRLVWGVDDFDDLHQ
jgi:hypothetical protein